jgi:ABC-type Fe3+-hydroxamate transport system substrate-binding protein
MRNRTIAIIMLALLCSALPLFAMGTREQDGTLSMRSATDALGRRVVVNGDINRILVVGKAAVMPADALFFFPAVEHMEIELAKTDQGLGDFFDLIRPELAGQARLGQNIGAEEIIARKPDLVITKSSNYETTGKQLEPFGIPVFVMDLETPRHGNRRSCSSASFSATMRLLSVSSGSSSAGNVR